MYTSVYIYIYIYIYPCTCVHDASYMHALGQIHFWISCTHTYIEYLAKKNTCSKFKVLGHIHICVNHIFCFLHAYFGSDTSLDRIYSDENPVHAIIKQVPGYRYVCMCVCVYGMYMCPFRKSTDDGIIKQVLV
jgi:hypothetical protein